VSSFIDTTFGRWTRNLAALAVMGAALALFAHPVQAEQGTACDSQLGARCMSTTYPSGQFAEKCSGLGCSTCWEASGSCDGGYGSTLQGFSSNKPGN
jgi:hypothetical protein